MAARAAGPRGKLHAVGRSAARSVWLVAWAGIRLVHALPEGALPRMQDVRLDSGVLLFAFATSIGVALIFGVIPAVQARAPGFATR
jgi:hypothetical protein